MELLILSHLESSISVKNFLQITQVTPAFWTEEYSEEQYFERKIFLADEQFFLETTAESTITVDKEDSGFSRELIDFEGRDAYEYSFVQNGEKVGTSDILADGILVGKKSQRR
jgi:hypothetical protein